MIDDDEEDFIITRDVLHEIPRRKYIIDWVPAYDEALLKIRAGEYQVYLVDYRLGAKNGLDLIRAALESGCTAPLILLTGQNDPEVDEQAMRAGAADYLVKGTISSRQLESSVRYSIEHAKNMNEIRLLNAELEKRVKDRTMILEEALMEIESSRKELQKALVKEKELNDLKSRFVSMASHEFRTPLATILSSLSLVSKYTGQQNEEKRNKHIERIKSSVHNLTEILNDFLSIGKLEEGKTESSPVLFDIKEFASESVQEMQAVAKQGQQIQYSHTGSRKQVCLDKKLLKNIIINLLSNAIKFSAENKNIRLSTATGNMETALIVSDEGVGISKEDQEHLFERFFRGQNVTNIQGTGLGLNIVSKYTELMNGKIEFESELGKGTKISIVFAEKAETY